MLPALRSAARRRPRLPILPNPWAPPAVAAAGGGRRGASTGTPPDAHPSLHVVLEPLGGENDGIFTLTLVRPAAKNAIGGRVGGGGAGSGGVGRGGWHRHGRRGPPLSQTSLPPFPPSPPPLGRQMLAELREAAAALRREAGTRCVVLRSGVPGAFCAGADLKERARMTRQEAAEFVASLRAAFSEVAALPMPVVAAVDGVALGGGAELALAADVRVAGPGAVFAFPETRLGIIPG